MANPYLPGIAKGINLLAEAHAAKQPRFDIYEDVKEPTHKWRWRIWMSSDIVAASSQGYKTKSEALENVKKVRDHITTLEQQGKLV